MTNNLYEKSVELINEFFLIQPLQDEKCEKIFETLKKIIPYNSGYIFFINPENIKIEYALNNRLHKQTFKIECDLSRELFKGIYSDKLIKLLDITERYIIEKLSINNTVFGFLLVTGDDFTPDKQKIFKTCASIISNLTKDIELSKIIKMQVEALQEGITDIHDENKKILEADKAKNDFLANITHELRTPLNSIIGFSELLTNEFIGSLNEKQREYINDIQVAGLHLLGMINEVLDISKIEANAMKLNLREFEIRQVITEICNILSPIANKKNINIETEIDNYTITADYQKIQQILFNLINNAIKFTSDNGLVKISAKRNNAKALITVEDNGIGIAKKFHKKIFEKFEQINNSSCCNISSTGLGLTITKELIKLHNGTIKVESEPQKGAKFVINLPLK